MISLFKKSKNNTEVVVTKGKSVNEIIDEIHHTFYTEVDRLLADAKITLSTHTDKTELLDKTARLRKLGFTKTEEVREGSHEELRLQEINRENELKHHLSRAILYFSAKYPNYKFITDASVKTICNKYNLVYAEVGLYKGYVPDKNLKHIEDFTIASEDRCAEMYKEFGGLMGRSIYEHMFLSETELKTENGDNSFFDRSSPYYSMVKKVLPLEIAAPIKDFDTTNMVVSNGQLKKIEIPDPIVLQPVIFEGHKHYLIVTAWGQEASDELVVNQKLN